MKFWKIVTTHEIYPLNFSILNDLIENDKLTRDWKINKALKFYDELIRLISS